MAEIEGFVAIYIFMLAAVAGYEVIARIHEQQGDRDGVMRAQAAIERIDALAARTKNSSRYERTLLGIGE